MTVSIGLVLGVIFGFYLACTTISTVHTADSTLFNCYDCSSQSASCPANAMVTGEAEEKIVVTNCTAGQRCYTRENKHFSNYTIYRGCTKSIWIPYSLPTLDGCYDFKGDVLCICTGDRCNKYPMGKGTGVALDAHTKTASGDVLPPKFKPRGKEGTIVCNVCNSGTPEKRNANCLADRSANWKTAWKVNCTGRCITKTNFLFANVEVFRECSDIWYEFPMPFRPDGCYDHYGDTVCICNKNLCNTLPLGRKSNIPLEYDKETKYSGVSSLSVTYLLTLVIILFGSLLQ